MSEHWDIVKRLVCEALDRAPDERAAFLDAADLDPDVRESVLALLAADERAGDFLASPVSVTGVRTDDADTLCLSKVCVACGARYGSASSCLVTRARFALKTERFGSLRSVPTATARS